MASTEKKAKEPPKEKLTKIFGKRSSRHGDGLPPCPFCGRAPDIVENAVGGLRTVSLECRCTARDDCYIQFTFEDEASAVAFWRKLDKTLSQESVPLEVKEPPVVPEKPEVAEKPQIKPWSKKKLAQKLLAFKKKNGLSYIGLEALWGISNRTLCNIGTMGCSSEGKRLEVQGYLEEAEREEVS
ncbi:hypothetical protein [Mailhella massiliensis]|uniref:hypothetical protein n=1 Tax=Mailhella massiliensis TaxID=1903261 RepID=UPI00097D6CF2|nr:hypothetical protein [Mailhella massiliensis]